MLRMTDVVKNLLIINVLFFIATYLFDQQRMLNMLALHYPASDLFRPLQLATHFFMHGGIGHIFFNMFALVMFGSALETLWGAKRFLYFYFICAFGAAALHMGYSWWDFSQSQALISQFKSTPSYDTFWQFFQQVPLDRLAEGNAAYVNAVYDLKSALASSTADPQAVGQAAQYMQEYLNFEMNVPVVGASGAIYGLLLAFGMMFPNTELMLIFLPIPIKANYFIPLLMLLELYLGFNQFSWDPIAHFAHLGGAVTGFLLILYWRQFGSRL